MAATPGRKLPGWRLLKQRTAGTILYSGERRLRGRVAPANRSSFATALAGKVSSEDSELSSIENEDLRQR